MQNSLRIAAIQMTSGSHVQANLYEAGKLLDQAAHAGAQMVLLPEYFAIMGLKDTDKRIAAEKIGHGPIQQFLSQRALEHGIWVIGGSVPIRCHEAKRIKNSCLVYNEIGTLVGRYDKIHLFEFATEVEHYTKSQIKQDKTRGAKCIDNTRETSNEVMFKNESWYYVESETISPGDKTEVVETPWGRIGLSICYDLRFPELYRAMQADIIFVPAAFTASTGQAHWETLLRARAIENLAYVIASAQVGDHANGRVTHGDSMIIDPWGVIIDRMPHGSGFVLATLDFAYQQKMRQQLPALQHKVL